MGLANSISFAVFAIASVISKITFAAMHTITIRNIVRIFAWLCLVILYINIWVIVIFLYTAPINQIITSGSIIAYYIYVGHYGFRI